MVMYQDEIEADEAREVQMLRQINDAVSDYLLALDYPEFAEEHGGIDSLLLDLRQVQNEWEREFNTND